MADSTPKNKERAAILIEAAFQAIHAAGGSLRMRDVLLEVERRVHLTEHDREIYPSTGNPRWRSILHFSTIPCVKAGFLRKSRGSWYLTPDGEKVLALPREQIMERALAAYRKWNIERRALTGPIIEDDGEDEEASEPSFVFEDVEAKARQEIEDHVKGLGPYEFQDLVAALLRGMDYSTPFVAPKGPDGGTDILAYPDPLGTQTPHIRVQVKHRVDIKATREEIAALRGVIRTDREVGMFVSTGGFAKPSVREAHQGNIHIELVDLERFLDLWFAHYERMSEEDKGLLRLRSVYLLSPE